MFIMSISIIMATVFSRSNNVITFIKLIVPIATVVVLIIMDFHATNFHGAENGGFMPFGWHGVLAALPLGWRDLLLYRL